MDIIEIFSNSIHGVHNTILTQLDPVEESEDYSIIEDTLDNLKKLFENSQDRKKILSVLRQIMVIQDYYKLIEKNVYLNEFNGKYGQVYIQARTSIKIEGKTKWISAYIGSLDEFPKGIHDPNAIRKGRILVRKKLKKLGIRNFS